MSYPPLENWESTRDALHQAAQVIGAIYVSQAPPLPNELEYSLQPTLKGVETRTLEFGGTLALEFSPSKIVYRNENGPGFQVPLTGHHQISLMDEVKNEFSTLGYDIEPSLKKITHDKPFQIEPDIATDARQVFNEAWQVLAQFKARLSGFMTPVVLWSHHFDLSFLWFHKHGSDEHNDPHMNFGFAPESEGFDRPYFYFYAYPAPDEMLSISLSAPARWIEEPFLGAVIDYDDIRGAQDMNSIVSPIFNTIHTAVADLMDKTNKPSD